MGNCDRNRDDEKREEVKRFMRLLNNPVLRYSVSVSSHALRTAKHIKAEKVDLIPLTSDIVVVNKYLKDHILCLIKQVTDAPRTGCFHRLVQCTVAYITVFNRKRSAEVPSIHVKRF